jgi:16S rRNA (cytidine1402-2'-O)-methyltransferase
LPRPSLLVHGSAVSETASRVPEPLEPGLYIVATPIGNLGDITLRAADVLRRCDVVACEDTRVTGKLMKHLGVSKPLWRYDDHSEHRDRERLVETLRSRAVALVSDAGTPLVSDPGYRLVNDCRAEGIAVTVLPGPCAAIAGLSVSGLPNDRFLFAGFLPSKEKARRDVLTELAGVDATLIFYETAPRLTKSLAAIGEALPDREIAVARELTKIHEELRRGLADGLIAWFEAHPPKGEIVLLIAPPLEMQQASAADADALLLEALQTSKASQAVAQVAKATGLDRKLLYARAMELKRG